MQVTAKNPGAANLMAHLCSELQIARTINNMVTWDEKQWKVSPGTLITALVINALVERQPLYNVQHFYEAMDMPLLFEEGIQANDLNDDALGRALDRLAKVDCRQLLGTVACQAARIEDMDISSVHADTTSFSVYGEYDTKAIEEADKNKHIEIVRGFNKDHQPHLKQLKFGLMVTNEGFPISGDVTSGNQSDNVWNRKIIDEFHVSFLETWDVSYVADSALITEENVRLMDAKKVRFISRLPGRFNLEQELIERAWKEGKWRSCGPMVKGKKAATYWTQPFQVEFVDKIYRFIVVRSSSLDKTKERTLQRQLDREKETLEKLIKTLSKEEFQCKPDAEARLKAILKDHDMLHALSGQVVENVSVKRKPGRPRKNHPEPLLETITYGIEWTIHPPTEQKLEDWRQRKTAFVLITSVSEALYDDYDVLKEYKKQINVEVRFRFLKDPMFVNAIYLKTPRRVEALGYVILLAVMIASLLELRIRNALDREKSTISAGSRKNVQRPTARLLLNMLNSILVVYLDYNGHTERHFPHDINPEVLRVLELAGYDRRIYTENPYIKLS
ncbi:MAG TPA: IS1634 family transposase [Firmicutes bacterium]|nr:IS1634 family transposase [Bacillota bacterium]